MIPIRTEDYLPRPAVIREIIAENSQIKTFVLALADQQANQAFTYKPGQFMMVSLPHRGEAPISFSSTPTRPGTFQLSVRRAGALTTAMHQLRAGDQIGLRGPYGRPFVMEDLQGRDLLFVAGGIGLAPLRSVINGCLDTPGHGQLTILYGSRVPSDIAFRGDIDIWQQHPAVACHLTVDAAELGWDGPVGLVTGLLDQVASNPASSIALVCGPPVMITAVLTALGNMGFADEDILTTMERHMKCGIGVCRHCHLDSKLVCVDGPVFSQAQLKKLQVDSL